MKHEDDEHDPAFDDPDNQIVFSEDKGWLYTYLRLVVRAALLAPPETFAPRFENPSSQIVYHGRYRQTLQMMVDLMGKAYRDRPAAELFGVDAEIDWGKDEIQTQFELAQTLMQGMDIPAIQKLVYALDDSGVAMNKGEECFFSLCKRWETIMTDAGATQEQARETIGNELRAIQSAIEERYTEIARYIEARQKKCDLEGRIDFEYYHHIDKKMWQQYVEEEKRSKDRTGRE